MNPTECLTLRWVEAFVTIGALVILWVAQILKDSAAISVAASSGRTIASCATACRPTSNGTPQTNGGRDWLKCSHTIVASVSQTAIQGIWIAKVNRHDEITTSCPYAHFRTRRAAVRSVERWACARAERLRREIATGARKKATLVPTREEKRLARQMRG